MPTKTKSTIEIDPAIAKAFKQSLEQQEGIAGPGQLCRIILCNHIAPSSACGEVVIIQFASRFDNNAGGSEQDGPVNVRLRYPQCTTSTNRNPNVCVIRAVHGILFVQGEQLKALFAEITPKPPIKCLNELPEIPMILNCPAAGELSVVAAGGEDAPYQIRFAPFELDPNENHENLLSIRTPQISFIDPSTVRQNHESPLTVFGQNFGQNSLVMVNSRTLATRFISNTRLEAQLTTEVTGTVGAKLVKVHDLDTGELSNEKTLTVE